MAVRPPKAQSWQVISARNSPRAITSRFAKKNDAALLHLRPRRTAGHALSFAAQSRRSFPAASHSNLCCGLPSSAWMFVPLRGGSQKGSRVQQPAELTGASLMPGFIHSSPAMTKLVEEVHKIRSSDVTVLVTGESGTGKELVARAIHALSSRRSKVFVPFNCTAVPKELSEGYLFGYRRGAFTGAVD